MKPSFSTSEVARYCHVTADTIRKWAEAGRIYVFKTPGGHRRIPREELLRFLRESDMPIHPDLGPSGLRVLVVDDEKSSANVITRSLERSQIDCQVQVAGDYYDAGHLMATFRPNVVFLDVQMPGISGFEICRRIKTAPEYGGTHVITMASSDDGTVAPRSMEAGASARLQKPFTPDELRRALAKVGVEAT